MTAERQNALRARTDQRSARRPAASIAGAAKRTAAALRRTAVAGGIWALVLAGFAFYLANFGSIDETYGSIGTTVVSLMWLILFSVLYYATPSLLELGRRRQAIVEAPPPAVASPGAELERFVRIALEDDAAHRGMWKALPGEPEEVPALLTAGECDLNDWGFTYGVAWAIARRRYPSESDQRIAERALEAARTVFGEYAGDEWSKRFAQRELLREVSSRV